MKENRPDAWYPWRIIGVIPASLFFVLFCPPVHAIGPYTAGSNTVVDQGTGLEWQKSDDATSRNWQNGLAYCEDLSLNSKTDWRLPNIRELKSIVNVSRYHPAIDPVFTCQSSSYWSATTVTNHPATSAWIVNFANGDDNWYVKTDSYRVRCVRAGILRTNPNSESGSPQLSISHGQLSLEERRFVCCKARNPDFPTPAFTPDKGTTTILSAAKRVVATNKPANIIPHLIKCFTIPPSLYSVDSHTAHENQYNARYHYPALLYFCQW